MTNKLRLDCGHSIELTLTSALNLRLEQKVDYNVYPVNPVLHIKWVNRVSYLQLRHVILYFLHISICFFVSISQVFGYFHYLHHVRFIIYEKNSV